MAGPLFPPEITISGARTAIRHHVIDALEGESSASDRIYATPYIPVDGERLKALGPIAMVYTGDETNQRDDAYADAPPRQKMLLSLFVQLVAHTYLPDLQDALDGMALAVIAIVLRDEQQGGNCDDTELVRVTAQQGVVEGGDPYTGLEIEFECQYPLSLGDDIEGVTPFEGADAGWDLAPPDGVTEAEDVVDVEQED